MSRFASGEIFQSIFNAAKPQIFWYRKIGEAEKQITMPGRHTLKGFTL